MHGTATAVGHTREATGPTDKGEQMTETTRGTAGSPHWLIRVLPYLGQIAGVTILLGILGYPLLHWSHYRAAPPWMGYIAIAIGFAVALTAIAWSGGLRLLLHWLGGLTHRAYMALLLPLCFVTHLAILRTIEILPGERAANPFCDWVFFKASAMYPRGHDLLMEAFRVLVLHSAWSNVLFTSIVVTVAAWLAYRLGAMAYGEPAGRLAGLVLAMFPSWMIYGNFEYDLLLGTLFLLLMYLFFVRPPEKHGFWYLAIWGLLVGATCLVKPTGTLAPLAAFLVYRAWRLPLGVAIKRAGIIALFLILAISPWTIRNYLVLNHFVLVSTNFGVVLHTANNPESVGLEMTMLPLPGETDEVEMDHRHIREAVDWIISNPVQFLKLTAYRVTWTWGSDTGFINSNGCLYGKLPPIGLNAVRGVVQIAYLATMFIWVAGGVSWRRRILNSVLAVAMLSMVVYIWAIHLVMQAHCQHHLPVLPFIIILAVGTLAHRAGLLAVGATSPATGKKGH